MSDQNPLLTAIRKTGAMECQSFTDAASKDGPPRQYESDGLQRSYEVICLPLDTSRGGGVDVFWFFESLDEEAAVLLSSLLQLTAAPAVEDQKNHQSLLEAITGVVQTSLVDFVSRQYCDLRDRVSKASTALTRAILEADSR